MSTYAWTSGDQRSRSTDVGPPWMRNSVGQGFGPSGSTSQPWTRWPCWFRNSHETNGPAGRRRARRREDRLVAARPRTRRRGARRAGAGTRRSRRADAGAGQAAFLHRQRRDLARLELVAVEVVAAVAELEQEHRGRVGPPVGDLGKAIPRDGRSVTSPVSTFQIAGARSPRRSWPIASRLSPGIGDQANAHRAWPSSRRSATTSPVRASSDAERRVDQVAVLGMLDARGALVGGEGRPGRGRP